MAHTFLRQIRVKSKAELKERILLGIAEINAAPWYTAGKSSTFHRLDT
jgi:hypothetical protein